LEREAGTLTGRTHRSQTNLRPWSPGKTERRGRGVGSRGSEVGRGLPFVGCAVCVGVRFGDHVTWCESVWL
jgi:hypothetical protein